MRFSKDEMRSGLEEMNRNTVYSNLFCLCDTPPSDEGESQGAERLQESLSELLPHLDFSSTCYLFSRQRPAEAMCFEDLLQEVSAFLGENRFLQMSVRPVHPFSGNDAEAWIAAYLRLLRVCRPFQEEGYREQIIARLRVFPVVFLKDAAAVMEAGPFLSFLQETFFLPSILVPSQAIDEVASLSSQQGASPWVRIYATDTSSFEPERALETLHAQEVFDKLLEDEAEALPEGNDSAFMEPLILDHNGDVRSGMKKNHLLSTMELVGISYRVNPQGATGWHQLCDRVATRFIGKGMHEPAITVWQSSALAYPSGAIPSTLLLRIALSQYERGDLEKAMEALTKAREGAPHSADIRYYMGQCEFGWRDYIEAADRFQEALELGLPNPLRVEANYYRGLSHYHLEEYDEALAPLREAENAGMTGSPLPFYQGLCLLGKEEPQQALPYLQEALSRGPSSEDHFHVLFYIAHTYKEMEDFTNALSYCAKAEEIQQNNYELWNLKGFCHFKQRNHNESIACFEKAIEIDPKSGIDYANIGSNLRDKGDPEGAIAMYEKALSLDPTIEFARDGLKRLLDEGKADSE
jgi:tetratricopeptide (TPR) repeat protein